ncbi:hypothetical protein PUN28_004724 [Cardiocondyla obscurior]|uniref:Uncharacterized protein n=1 Tax=Cardiocondyla obscurior TaxID=286306 RepID=A0AAW2GIE2_9HYME
MPACPKAHGRSCSLRMKETIQQSPRHRYRRRRALPPPRRCALSQVKYLFSPEIRKLTSDNLNQSRTGCMHNIEAVHARVSISANIIHEFRVHDGTLCPLSVVHSTEASTPSFFVVKASLYVNHMLQVRE